MSVSVCIQKIQLIAKQILNCEVQNSHLKSIIFKLHRKVELGSKTIDYLHYYFTKEPEKFNSKQTSNILIGFLASLDSNYQYINPVENTKGGFLNQLLGLSEDNVKREFYFLLQGLDESIIEVQNVLESALNVPFNDLPDLGSLSPLPPTAALPLSPTSPLNESFSNINEFAFKTKAEPIRESSNEMNSTLDIKSDQDVSKSKPVNLPANNQKAEIKPAETTSELTQAMGELSISKANNSPNPTESQEKEYIPVKKAEPENNAVSNKMEKQALINGNINENQVRKENTNNAQPVSINQNSISTPIASDNSSSIRLTETGYSNQQSTPMATSENYSSQNLNQTKPSLSTPLQSNSNATIPTQNQKIESSAIETQPLKPTLNNNGNTTNTHTNPATEKKENDQKIANGVSQPGVQSPQNNSLDQSTGNTIKNLDTVPANISNQPCNQNQNSGISSHTSPVQQQAMFNNQIQQPWSPNSQGFSYPGSPSQQLGACSPNQIHSPNQPIHLGSPHYISSSIQPIHLGSQNHISSPMQPVSPSHLSCGSPNSLYSNPNQPPPLPQRPSPIPSPEQHYRPPPASLFPQPNHYQSSNPYTPPIGSTSPVQQHYNPGYTSNLYQPPPQLRPMHPQHGHTHSAHMPNFNDSLAFPPMNQFIRPNSPGYINPPQFGFSPPQPQMMMPSPDQFVQPNSPQHSNYKNQNRRNMPIP